MKSNNHDTKFFGDCDRVSIICTSDTNFHESCYGIKLKSFQQCRKVQCYALHKSFKCLSITQCEKWIIVLLQV